MGGEKGRFDCSENHLAHRRHSREKIFAAIERLKTGHPTVLLTVGEFSYIYQIEDTYEKEETNEEFHDQV